MMLSVCMPAVQTYQISMTYSKETLQVPHVLNLSFTGVLTVGWLACRQCALAQSSCQSRDCSLDYSACFRRSQVPSLKPAEALKPF